MTATAWGVRPHDAEDLASEAILAVATYTKLDHKRLDQLLRTVFRRRYIDLLRQNTCAQKANIRFGAALEQHGGEEELIATLAIETMLRGAGLSPAERRILLLHATGYRHGEIGERLGISRHASELGLARARAKVRSSAESAYTGRRAGSAGPE